MKNAFYFALLKDLLAFQKLQLLFWISGHVWKRLDKKAKVNFISTMPQTGSQTITINILTDILKSKGYETMKFGQLIEYNMTKIQNIFLKNHAQNVVWS